jgi:FMN phosphatase YigB (HAD superfamily)
MQKIRAVLFDLDNTLVDFVKMKEESCRAATKAMINIGLKMNEEEA